MCTADVSTARTFFWAFRLAPASSSMVTTLGWSSTAAWCKGVEPACKATRKTSGVNVHVVRGLLSDCRTHPIWNVDLNVLLFQQHGNRHSIANRSSMVQCRHTPLKAQTVWCSCVNSIGLEASHARARAHTTHIVFVICMCFALLVQQEG